jgi:sugar O-acyltransferase (sialic acid O-acetyltransferase NeuD family)
VILGAGGHAKVLIDCIQAAGTASIRGILESDPEKWETAVLGVPILGGDAMLPVLRSQGISHFVVGVGSVGDSRVRKRLYNLGLSHELLPLTILHPRAVCSAHALLGQGVQVLPGAIINAGAILGNNIIVNSGAIVEHDCTLGDHVHIATGARLAGTVSVETGAHIGIGAAIRQGIRIGEGAIVGAGAVVVRDVAPRTVVVGVPASVLRTL